MANLISRISKLEQTPAAIIAEGFQQLAPVIDGFMPIHDACFYAWQSVFEGHIAREAPELSYLFPIIDGINSLPEGERKAATAAALQQYRADLNRLNDIFFQQVKAAQCGERLPMVDCPEYHVFVDLLEQMISLPKQFKAQHGQELASELATRVEQHIEKVIASYEPE